MGGGFFMVGRKNRNAPAAVFCLMLFICLLFASFTAPALAAEPSALDEQVIAACREYGISSGCFPRDVKDDELVAEAFEISALKHSYSMWLVTTTRQPDGVEFGWVAYQTPSHTRQSSDREFASYQQERQKLMAEVEKGCYHFWSAEEKAEYSYHLYRQDARITFPNENELSQDAAVERARNNLMPLLGLTAAQTEVLLVDATFYQDETRYWGITFRQNSVDGPLPLEPLYAVVIDGPTGVVQYAIDYRKDLVVDAFFQNTAMNIDELLPRMSFDVQPDQSIWNTALNAILSNPSCIVSNEADGLYDFPSLEVEHRSLSWRTTLLQGLDGEKIWIVSFFPENIPQMAATVAVRDDDSIACTFFGTTWMMQQHWEEALGIPGYFWPVNMRYAFHMLFEPDGQWHAPALPSPDGVPQDEAEQKAGMALLERQYVSSEAALSAYRVAAQYASTQRYHPEGSNIWTILYYQPCDGEWQLVYSVDLDGKSGEVLDVSYSGNSLG